MGIELDRIKPSKNEIKLGGKKRKIRYGFAVWAKIEEDYGTIPEFMEKVVGDIKLHPFSVALDLIDRGLVRGDDETITKDQISKWLDEYEFPQLMEIIGNLKVAIFGAQPKAKDGDKDPLKAE